MSRIEELVIGIRKSGEGKEELYDKLKGLLYFICKRYCSYARKKGYEIDDLVSIAWIGVEKAIETFQEDKGVKFTFYIGYYVKKAIAAFLGFQNGDPLLLSLDAPIPGNEDLTLGSTIKDQESEFVFEEIETSIAYKEAVKTALDGLEDKFKDILVKHYLENKTLKGIAEEKCCSTENIRQLKSLGLRKIRANQQIREFYEEEFRNNFHHVTLSRFNTTWTSAPEQAVLNIERFQKGKSGI